MKIKNKDKLSTEDLITYTRLCRKLKAISRNTKSAIINSWKCKHPCFICKWKKFCKLDKLDEILGVKYEQIFSKQDET